MKFIASKLLISAALVAPVACQAAPAVSLLLGNGENGDIQGVVLIPYEDFWQKELAQNSGKFAARIEFSAARIQGDPKAPGGEATVIGVTPVLRYEPSNKLLYAEFGIGANYFSQREITSRKSVGTHFEFGDLIGFGIRLGEKKEVEIGYRFIHYSNAGMSSNNPGLDFHQIRLQLGF